MPYAMWNTMLIVSGPLLKAFCDRSFVQSFAYICNLTYFRQIFCQTNFILRRQYFTHRNVGGGGGNSLPSLRLCLRWDGMTIHPSYLSPLLDQNGHKGFFKNYPTSVLSSGGKQPSWCVIDAPPRSFSCFLRSFRVHVCSCLKRWLKNRTSHLIQPNEKCCQYWVSIERVAGINSPIEGSTYCGSSVCKGMRFNLFNVKFQLSRHSEISQMEQRLSAETEAWICIGI